MSTVFLIYILEKKNFVRPNFKTEAILFTQLTHLRLLRGRSVVHGQRWSHQKGGVSVSRFLK